MTNPWDPMPSPNHGDDDDSILFQWVGRLMSQWEHCEHTLSRLFTVFSNKPDDGPTLREYGKPTIFKERLRGLRERADKYFIEYPHQELEAEFDYLCEAAEGFASRRNEVAHGVSFPTRLLPFFRDKNIGWDRWAITPTYYALRSFDQTGYAKYAYTSRELNMLVLRIQAFLVRIRTFFEAIRRARGLPPEQP